MNSNYKEVFRKNYKNYLGTFGLVAVLLVVLVGASQVILKNLKGDQASALISNNYLAQIGLTSVDGNSNGAFSDSKKICQSIDGACQYDGLIDYTFSNISNRTGISEANGGGLILDKSSGLFVQNGDFTSQNFVPKAGYGVVLTKIQIGVGLKPETLVSVGYSVDGGSNFQTAIGNYTNDQLKSQQNQNIIEYSLPTAARINQGFSYRIALKADSKKEASPSLKFVRVFYEVAVPSSSTSSGATTSGTTSTSSGTTTSGTTSTSSGSTTSGTTTSGSTSTSSGSTTSGTTSTSSGATSTSSGTTTSGTTTSGTTSTSSGSTTSGSTTSGSTSTSSGTTSGTTSTSSGSTSSSSGNTSTSTSSSGTFLPVPSGGGDSNNKL